MHSGRPRLCGRCEACFAITHRQLVPKYTTEGAKRSSTLFELSMDHHHILSPYTATTLHQLYHITLSLLPTHPLGNTTSNGSPGEEVKKKRKHNEKYCQVSSASIASRSTGVNTLGGPVGRGIPWGAIGISRYKSKPKSILSSQPACKVSPFCCLYILNCHGWYPQSICHPQDVLPPTILSKILNISLTSKRKCQ